MSRATRRQFCRGISLLLVAPAAAIPATACRPRDAAPPPAPADAGAPALQTFTVATFATLSAVCERLLPRDEDPGAIDLGVPGYIDGALASPDLVSSRELLLRVLPILDKESRKRFGGKKFHEAAAAEQDTVIGAWQHGRDGSQHFFDVILSLTLEGAFGDPKHGGNLGGRGFAMIGFTPDLPLSKAAMSAMHHDGAAP
jgi:gluconate 2-dehydrogenase gamma chain